MSNFTTEVRWICEDINADGSPNGYNNIEQNIEKGRQRIFDFNYPLFDPLYKETLETKIIRHFYTREIGYETVGLWKLKLCDKLNLIMPYYNQLYESTLIEFDPLIDVNYRRDGRKNDTRNNVNDEQGNENVSGNESRSGNEVEIGNKNENRSKEETLNREENSNEIKAGNKNATVNESNSESESKNKRGNSIQTENRNKQYDGTDTGTNSEENNDITTGAKNNNSTKNKSGTDDKWDLYSDTPQSGVQGMINFGNNPTGSGTVQGNAYLSNARRNTDEYSDTENDIGRENTTEIGRQSKSGNTRVVYDYDTIEQNNNTGINNEDISGTKEGSKTKSNNESNSDTTVGRSNRNDAKNGSENMTGNETNIRNNNVNVASGRTKSSNKTGREVSTGNQDYFETIIGKRGAYSYSKMLDEFRKTFLNIDLMIINELEPLFMGLWE